MTEPHFSIAYIDTNDALLRLVSDFSAYTPDKKAVCLDTEFIRETTYRADLCLIQCAFNGHAVVIDPKAEGLDLTPFINILKDKSVLKVLHSARQDYEIFFNNFGFLPEPLFDTQIAAAFSGYGDQIGFEALVKAVTGVSADKSQQRTDWKRRPLTEEQIKYAACDAGFLQPVYEKLYEKLTKTGRMTWLEEESRSLLQEKTYLPDYENAYKRIKKNIRGEKALSILQAICAFRERVAEHKNLTRNRVFSDDVAVKIAEAAPKSFNELKTVRGLSDKFIYKYGQKVAENITQALHSDKKALQNTIEETRPIRLTPSQEIIADYVKITVKITAATLNISPRLLAGTNDINTYTAFGDAPFMHGWRGEAVGENIRAIKDGRAALKLKRSGEEIRPFLEVET